MLVLGIESTCDETACAIVQDGKKILSNVIYSQESVHSPYGGVFPELACRRHIEVFIPLIQEALMQAQIERADIDLIAVAKEPGLIGALLVGLNAAKALSFALNKPFVGVNHVEAHLYAAMMSCTQIPFPALGVVISGGHTFLVKILGLGSYQLIGTTVDDAIGEAFDKVARMLGLPYPGGAFLEALARKGNPSSRYSFKTGQVKEKPWNFSFSGIKTSVLYAVKNLESQKQRSLVEEEKADIAATFQEAVLSEIVDKAIKAAYAFSCKALFLGGGVCNNTRLRTLFEEKKLSLPLYWPPKELTLDNAAMIAGLGYHLFQMQKRGDSLDLEPSARASLGTQ